MPWCVLNENILYALSLQAKVHTKCPTMYILNDNVHVEVPPRSMIIFLLGS